MIKFNESDIEFDVIWHPETDIRPEDSFTEDEDVDWVYQQLQWGNEWAWCMVEVRGTYTGPNGKEYTASEFLGGCSYRSEEDFCKPGGYFDDMKHEVTEQIRDELCRDHMGFDDKTPKGIVRDAMIDLGLIRD